MTRSNLAVAYGVACLALFAIACSDPDDGGGYSLDSGLKSGAPVWSNPAGEEPEADAEVEFGSEHAGSPFFPPGEHDRSFHGMDKIVPRTVVIPVGGSIDFEVYPFHQVAIYEPGKTPEDIIANLEDGDATLEDLVTPVFIPDFVINDPEGRIALGPAQAAEEFHWVTPEGLFDSPGKYLMMCTTAPHFLEAKMYGWIIVR